jgi:hypothetical protein
MTAIIVGIDVSTESKKCFFALAKVSGDTCSLEWIADGLANNQEILIDKLAGAIMKGEKVLFAIDSPLGWPIALGNALSKHQAGGFLKTEANKLFRRVTDDEIHRRLGKRPLDVGADRIARTAHAALALMENFSSRLKKKTTLAWSPNIESISAIEVYPAATLKAYGITNTKYKGKEGRLVRQTMLNQLETYLSIPHSLRSILIENDNAFDSAVCVLTGQDFILGKCYAPVDLNLAKREGWIWVRKMQGD